MVWNHRETATQATYHTFAESKSLRAKLKGIGQLAVDNENEPDPFSASFGLFTLGDDGLQYWSEAK